MADINDSSEEGKQVLASARHILKSLGKPDATEISLADMADIEKLVAGLEFNGDGVVSAKQIVTAGLRATVEDIIKCDGSVADLSGEAGINQDISDKFFAEAAAYSAWHAKAERCGDFVPGRKDPGCGGLPFMPSRTRSTTISPAASWRHTMRVPPCR